jgi:hypothetical protein
MVRRRGERAVPDEQPAVEVETPARFPQTDRYDEDGGRLLAAGTTLNVPVRRGSVAEAVPPGTAVNASGTIAKLPARLLDALSDPRPVNLGVLGLSLGIIRARWWTDREPSLRYRLD